jgi:hypothetical protein
MKPSTRWFASIALVLLSMVHSPCLVSDCNETVLNALKTRVDEKVYNTAVLATHYLACNQSSAHTNVQGGVGVYWGGFGNKTTEAACWKNDLAYFDKYSYQIAYSFIPPGAWEVIAKICTPQGTPQLTVVSVCFISTPHVDQSLNHFVSVQAALTHMLFLPVRDGYRSVKAEPKRKAHPPIGKPN